MGMLQLAGIVSGLGNGLQQGLETTQKYMTYSMLQKEREEMELKRLKLTYELEGGLLQKKNDYAVAAQAQEQENRQANIKLQGDIETGHITKRGEVESGLIGRRGDEERKTYGVKHAGDLELQGNQIAATAAEGVANRASNERMQSQDLKSKLAMQQVEVGSALVQLRMKLDRPETEAKLSPRVAAKMDYFKTRLEGLNKFIASSLDEESIKEAKKEVGDIGRQVDQLLDFSKERQPFVDPMERIAKHDQWRGSGPLEGSLLKDDGSPQATNLRPSNPNLPRFGNVEPTLADLMEFQGQYDAAQKSGGNVSAVVEAFKDRFGRIPTQADYDRVRNAGR